MLERKAIVRFALLVSVFALFLLYPWPVVVKAYSSAFRTGANAVFTRYWFWSQGSVRFVDLHAADVHGEVDRVTQRPLPARVVPPGPSGVLDTLMVMRNRSTPGNFGMLRVSSRALGYWPTAWLIALCLAIPMPWRRRCRALAWGLLLVHAFIVFRLTIKLAVDGFSGDKAYALFHPSEFWAGLLGRIAEVAAENPTVSFVVPTVIWLVVAFSRSEWAALRGQLAFGGSGDAPP